MKKNRYSYLLVFSFLFSTAIFAQSTESDDTNTKFTATIYLLSKEEGGRHSAVNDNFKTIFGFDTKAIEGVIKFSEGTISILPGSDPVKVTIILSSAIVLEEKMRFTLKQGFIIFGSGVVTEVLE